MTELFHASEKCSKKLNLVGFHLPHRKICASVKKDPRFYTLSEAWSGVNWADLMAAQGAFGTDFYDRSKYSVQNIVLTIVLVDLS